MANTVAAQLFIDGAFTSKTAFIEESITAEFGPDPDSGTEPSEIALTWDNSDLSMDPSNVLGALYGKIGRYTQMRLQVGGTTLLSGEAKSWLPDRTIGHTVSPARGRSATGFTAVGILDRLQLWKDPLRSPLFSQTMSYVSLLGYWPSEGQGTSLANPVPNGFNGKQVGSLTRGGDPGPAGADEAILLGADGALSGSFIRVSNSGWQVCFAAKMPNILTATLQTIFTWRVSSGLRYEWRVSNAQYAIVVTRESDSTILANTASSFGGGNSPLQWVRMRCKVTVSGSVVTVEPAWYMQDLSFITGYTETFAGTTTGNLSNWNVDPSPYTVGMAIGQIFAVSDATLNLTSFADVTKAFNGYSGEAAGTRWFRLLGQAGIVGANSGTLSNTVAMGPQKPGLIYDLLEECVATDGALQWDQGDTATFRTRVDRFGQTSHLDLTYNVNVAPPLQKQITPSGVANQITISNSSGVSATVTKTTGALSTANPPAGIGTVKGNVDVNQLSDDTLDDRGFWELNRSTLDRPRYQQITVDLLAHPELITACNALRPGDLITLSGVEPDPVQLHAMRIAHKIDHTTRTFTIKCVPAETWKTGTYGGTGRYGVAASTVNTTMTATSTALAALLADPLDAWSTTATGYDLVVLGERWTVTGAFSAPSAGVQTATVTRSVNGVVRTHAIGELIQLYSPTRYAY